MRRREGNFVLERQDDRLIASSIYSGMALGVILWIAALTVILAINVRDGFIDLSRPYDAAVATLLFGVGLFAMLRREISTSFESGSRQVVQERILGRLWRWRRRRYSFDEIAGIGIKVGPGDDGQNYYRPIMTLKNGSSVSLTHFEESRSNSNDIMTDICAATGLSRLDVDDTENPSALKS
jgi:hypothetical protein